MTTIGAGADKFWGVRRIFARIFPNLPEKFLCDFYLQIVSHNYHKDLFFMWPSQKKVFVYFSANVMGAIFSSQTTLALFSRIFMEFVRIFSYFAQIFTDFARIFNKSKLLGCSCTHRWP